MSPQRKSSSSVFQRKWGITWAKRDEIFLLQYCTFCAKKETARSQIACIIHKIYLTKKHAFNKKKTHIWLGQNSWYKNTKASRCLVSELQQRALFSCPLLSFRLPLVLVFALDLPAALRKQLTHFHNFASKSLLQSLAIPRSFSRLFLYSEFRGSWLQVDSSVQSSEISPPFVILPLSYL